jgi:hypothetical protein
MKKGFMRWVRDAIQDFPGLTQGQYAYLAGYGYAESDAKGDPVPSHGGTLAKQVKGMKEPHIRREKIGGKYRYFPIMGVATKTSIQNISFRISLSNEEWQGIDNLISKGDFRNRNEVIEWLAKRCISAGVGLSWSDRLVHP